MLPQYLSEENQIKFEDVDFYLFHEDQKPILVNEILEDERILTLLHATRFSNIMYRVSYVKVIYQNQ